MKVKVYSTQMGEKEIETSAQDWGGLQQELKRNGISYSGMKSVIGETKHTLEVDSAGIPQTDFTLFLMPVKTKSGICADCDPDVMSYKELRGSIKDILDGDETAKSHFNSNGKNYTTKSTVDLRELYRVWVSAGVVAEAVTSSYDDMSYKDLRGTIKGILDTNEAAKSHFNVGKNYTTKSTDTLRELLNTWTGETPSVEAVASNETLAPTIKQKKSKKDKFEQRAKAVSSREPTMADKYQELINEFPNVIRY
jgi:hypothetical protein